MEPLDRRDTRAILDGMEDPADLVSSELKEKLDDREYPDTRFDMISWIDNYRIIQGYPGPVGGNGVPGVDAGYCKCPDRMTGEATEAVTEQIFVTSTTAKTEEPWFMKDTTTKVRYASELWMIFERLNCRNLAVDIIADHSLIWQGSRLRWVRQPIRYHSCPARDLRNSQDLLSLIVTYIQPDKDVWRISWLITSFISTRILIRQDSSPFFFFPPFPPSSSPPSQRRIQLGSFRR